MPAVLQATGLVPALHPSGQGRESNVFYGTSYASGVTTKAYDFATGASGYVYKGTPVGINAAGQLTVAAAVGGATTSTATQIYGVFVGCEYTDAQGRRAVSTWFNDNLIATNQDPQVWFWILTDAEILYEIQVAGALAAGVGSVGDEFNFVSTGTTNRPQDGSVAPGGLGYSTTALNATPVVSGAQGQVRCRGLGRQAGGINNFSDAFPTLLVEIANTSSRAPKGGL